MRRNAVRASGSIDQPTSWPCVLAITRRAPASRASGAISASGAAAPNHTVSTSWRSTSRRIRVGDRRLGQHQRARMPHHLIAARPGRTHRSPSTWARTPSACGRPASTRWLTKSRRYDWMPPRRGGKSLVTSRTRLIASQASRVHTTAATRSAASARSAPSVSRTAAASVGVAVSARPHVQRPQRRGAVRVGDEAAEPPGAVVGRARGRVRSGRRRWESAPTVASGGGGVCGRPTKSATPSVSHRGASAAVSARAA